jgi:hypothetical protein
MLKLKGVCFMSARVKLRAYKPFFNGVVHVELSDYYGD